MVLNSSYFWAPVCLTGGIIILFLALAAALGAGSAFFLAACPWLAIMAGILLIGFAIYTQIKYPKFYHVAKNDSFTFRKKGERSNAVLIRAFAILGLALIMLGVLILLNLVPFFIGLLISSQVLIACTSIGMYALTVFIILHDFIHFLKEQEQHTIRKAAGIVAIICLTTLAALFTVCHFFFSAAVLLSIIDILFIFFYLFIFFLFAGFLFDVIISYTEGRVSMHLTVVTLLSVGILRLLSNLFLPVAIVSPFMWPAVGVAIILGIAAITQIPKRHIQGEVHLLSLQAANNMSQQEYFVSIKSIPQLDNSDNNVVNYQGEEYDLTEMSLI